MDIDNIVAAVKSATEALKATPRCTPKCNYDDLEKSLAELMPAVERMNVHVRLANNSGKIYDIICSLPDDPIHPDCADEIHDLFASIMKSAIKRGNKVLSASRDTVNVEK